jgi:hypothetical protein
MSMQLSGKENKQYINISVFSATVVNRLINFSRFKKQMMGKVQSKGRVHRSVDLPDPTEFVFTILREDEE